MNANNKFQIESVSAWQRGDLGTSESVVNAVSEMLQQLEQNPETSIEKFSQQFDGFIPEFITLKPFAEYAISDEVADALQFAASNIENFGQQQRDSIQSQQWSNEFGTFRQRIVPLSSMAAYIPAGRYPLVSTALMTLIPAKVAGVERRIALTTSDSEEMLAAMSLAGATQVLKIGGVQAIAAASLGYGKLAAVDCIVGPGNAYVAEAKKQLSKNTRIDSVAGPSELLVWADSSVKLDWIIKDMLAQAEHDPMAQSLFVSQDKVLCQKLLDQLQSTASGQQLLQDNQVAVLSADSESEAIDFINDYAPEHLMLVGELNREALTNYGSMFIGNNSAVAFGDYCAGPNHTLPTLAGAKQKGGLSVFDFVKILTEQDISDQGRAELARAASVLADIEGLVEHKASADIRK